MKNILIVLLILSIIAFGIFEVNKMAANEYIYPTGYNDPNGSWTGEANAYDGNSHTSATSVIPASSWSNYIELTTNAVYCSKIKFLALYSGTNGINSVDIDVYYEGAWHDLYEGSFLNSVWVEKSLSATQYVTKMRYRFYCNGAHGATAAIYEAMFYETIGVPVMTTAAATDVSGGEATLNGNMVNNGGAVPTVRGFKYKEEIGGAEQDTHENGYFSVEAYSKDLTGLDPSKEYYFRAYATNTEGTGYGEWLSMGEAVAIPTLSSSAATLITHEKATLNGNITATGGEDPEERGFQWKIGATGDVETLPETGTFGVGAYTLDLEDLSANVQYYFRAYAKNAGGTGYGTWLNFTTDYAVPEVTTHNATDELKNQVTGNGEIVSTGGQDCDERGFDYGLDKVNTSTKSESAGSYGVGHFDLDITGLTENTDYWYRAFAKYALFNPLKRTTSAYDKECSKLQIVGDLIYYIWYEYDSNGDSQVWTAVSNLDGSGFVATQRTTSAYDKYGQNMQVVGSKIYYVWYESDGTNYQIWTAVIDTDGTGWSVTKQTTSAYDKFDPQLQVVNDTIYYTWYEMDASNKHQIWVATSDLNGENFTATKKTTTAYHKYRVEFQVVGTVIYYVWYESDGTYTQIWIASMDTDGTNWSATKKTTTNFNKLEPQLQVVVDKIYYVWREFDAASKYQIWIATMDTDGNNWATTKKTTSAYSKYEPQLQVVGTVIYYVWREDDGSNDQIWIATMDTDGSDWAATKKTTSAYDKEYPRLQVVSGVIYYVWDEDDGTKQQIWTAKSAYIAYGEWMKFITAAIGTIPTGTKKVICSDYSGYTYRTQASETDDGQTYTAYFVISTDLTNKQGLAFYKRILDLHLYFKNQISGTVTVEVKRDSEPAWQEVGDVTLTGVEEILVKHLATNIRAKHFLFKLSATNQFKFLGCLFEYIREGDR